MLHGRRGVELGERGGRFDLEGIVRAAMVQVVAEAGDDQGEAFDLPEDLPPLRRGQDGEHHLGDVEGVPPVVVGDVSVVLFDGEQPPAQDFVFDVEAFDEVQVEEHPQARR